MVKMGEDWQTTGIWSMDELDEREILIPCGMKQDAETFLLCL